MSGATSSYPVARFILPEYISRGNDNTLSCPVYQDGALVAPDSASFSLFDGAGKVIFTGSAAISGSIASITVPAASLPTSLSFSATYKASWVLDFSGDEETFSNSAHLIRAALHPVVTDLDLFRRVSSLDPNGPAPISSNPDYQDYRDEAWASLVSHISSQGPLPYLIMEPTALREAHMMLTLQLIFEDFATRLNEVYAEKAEVYEQRYAASFSRIKFQYDQGQDGNSDGPRKRPLRTSVWFK